MKSTRLFFFIPLLFLIACAKNETKRANDPWVFRSVLDKKPRMVTIALNKEMWAAYRTDSCILYKVWRGNVNLDGPVYNTHHGPQPTTVGDSYFENHFNQPWSIIIDGKTQAITPNYKGHWFKNGGVTLLYEVNLPDGKKFSLHERPEFVQNTLNNGVAYERIFTTEDMPTNIQLALKVNVSGIAALTNIKTDGGTWNTDKTMPYTTEDNAALMHVEGTLTLKTNGQTNLTTYLAQASIPNKWDDDLNVAAVDNTPLGAKLIEKSDCQTCHNEVKQTVGPGYAMIAQRYENTPTNINMLTKKVRNGGSGVWGQAAMSPHLTTPESDIREMVVYIMSLDKETESVKKNGSNLKDLTFKEANKGFEEKDLIPGLMFNIYDGGKGLAKLPVLKGSEKPVFSGIMMNFDATENDLKEYPDNHVLVATGFIKIEKDNNYLFRIGSDDGTKLYLNNQLIADNDGPHGTEFKDAEMALRAGLHPIRIEFFQGGGGKNFTLQWTTPEQGEFVVIPPTAFSHKKADESALTGAAVTVGTTAKIPGDGSTLVDAHPSYTLSQARPDGFTPKVGGMDFKKNGDLVVSTWDPAGSVYILKGTHHDKSWKMRSKLIANGLAEPLGLKVIEGKRIFVLQKQELTELIDHNGDEVADEYRTVANGWRVSANFHEFAFGLAFKDGYFYATLATAINPGGASTKPQIPDRGKVVKIDPNTGHCEFIAHGLRTPNGIGVGIDGELFVADNQGDWLPSSKIVHVKQGAFYGSHSVDSIGTWFTKEQAPVVWLPQDEIGNSPSQPSIINDGSPYSGQMIHGEVTHGGVKRVFVEKINGDYQGCVFEFTQGLEAGVNRLCWSPDGHLYIGGIGNPGNWGQTGKQWFGLQKMKYNKQSTFEMLAIRAKTNGIEIEMTEPLKQGEGWNPSDFLVKQWWYQPTINYGGPKMEEEKLAIASSSVSPDGKKVFLEIKGIKEGHVVYVRIMNKFVSQLNHSLWATEGWYTMNQIPKDNYGRVLPNQGVADNTLSEWEKTQGFSLLFDGKSLNGWHNYGKPRVEGSAWIVDNGAIHLNAVRDANGDWQSKNGGDILTANEYENYEFTLEWKIDRCGNSGIFYNIIESDKYQYGWQTGPEMQILDNTCHPDGRIVKHRAGDLYDLISCKYETVKPAGEWNKIRIIMNNGHLEHWLNGVKVVETQLWTKEWDALVAKSKFPNMSKDFGTARRGRISLQDHGDKVWFKNIKIRDLGSGKVASR
jgi:cytochrome c